MDPSMYASMLPSFAQQQPMPFAPGGLQSPDIPQLGQQRGGMFGGMNPMFGMMGMMHGYGPYGMLGGLAGLGLHALKVI